MTLMTVRVWLAGLNQVELGTIHMLKAFKRGRQHSQKEEQFDVAGNHAKTVSYHT